MERYLPNKIAQIYNERFTITITEGKYKSGEGDTQIEKDALDAIRREIQKITWSVLPVVVEQDTRHGEMVEEQVTETETMAPGSMGDATQTILISYDQLRARLPAEITDDIVELND